MEYVIIYHPHLLTYLPITAWLYPCIERSQSLECVFGLVRNVEAAKDALELTEKNLNVHIIQADVTDTSALKVL